jgi:anti-anti-sigma factor
MEFSQQKLGGDLVFAMSGRMTFSDHKAFREILRQVGSENFQRIVIDVSRLDFIDSFGIGMLLIVKDAAEQQSRPVVLRKPSGQVERLVQVAKLAKLFIIE